MGACPTRPRKMSAEPRGLTRGRSALKPRAKYFQRRNMDSPVPGCEIAAWSEVIVPERARAGVDLSGGGRRARENLRTSNFARGALGQDTARCCGTGAKEEDVRLRMPSDVLDVEASGRLQESFCQALALRNFLAAKTARPSAPLPKSAREEGSGTGEGTGGPTKVARNNEDPEAEVLKVRLAGVLVKPGAERVVTPEKSNVLPTVVSV